MSKWSCRDCGLNLENRRQLAEFPLVHDGCAIYCRDCAKKVKTAYIRCEYCGKQVIKTKSRGGRYCDGICEIENCKRRMRRVVE
jgi:hypothetical protein